MMKGKNAQAMPAKGKKMPAMKGGKKGNSKP
jgi:hypothetical protein